jgi:hypothetical protein
MNYVPLPRAVVPIVTVATVVLLVWVGWESILFPEAFWAPGDLSQYHASVARCVHCHEPFQGPSSVRCQACHYKEDFAARSEPTVRDHHLSVIDQRKTCVACHTEHRGILAGITTGVLPDSKTPSEVDE